MIRYLNRLLKFWVRWLDSEKVPTYLCFLSVCLGHDTTVGQHTIKWHHFKCHMQITLSHDNGVKSQLKQTKQMPISVYASTQSDLGLCFRLTESLSSVECTDVYEKVPFIVDCTTLWHTWICTCISGSFYAQEVPSLMV